MKMQYNPDDQSISLYFGKSVLIYSWCNWRYWRICYEDHTNNQNPYKGIWFWCFSLQWKLGVEDARL